MAKNQTPDVLIASPVAHHHVVQPLDCKTSGAPSFRVTSWLQDQWRTIILCDLLIARPVAHHHFVRPLDCKTSAAPSCRATCLITSLVVHRHVVTKSSGISCFAYTSAVAVWSATSMEVLTYVIWKYFERYVYLYSTFMMYLTLKALRYGSHSFYLQITPYLPLPRKHSPDGAFPDWDDGHLIAAYYSFIYPERMKAWVGLVGWPVVDGLPT